MSADMLAEARARNARQYAELAAAYRQQAERFPDGSLGRAGNLHEAAKYERLAAEASEPTS